MKKVTVPAPAVQICLKCNLRMGGLPKDRCGCLHPIPSKDGKTPMWPQAKTLFKEYYNRARRGGFEEIKK